MDKNKLILPIAIVLGCVVLGGSFYAVQVSKQKSIEKQQLLEIEEKTKQQKIENERGELKLKQEECEALSSGVKKKWYNVVGVTYDNEFWEECVVTYTDTKTGEIEISPLRLMKDN